MSLKFVIRTKVRAEFKFLAKFLSCEMKINSNNEKRVKMAYDVSRVTFGGCQDFGGIPDPDGKAI